MVELVDKSQVGECTFRMEALDADTFDENTHTHTRRQIHRREEYLPEGTIRRYF